MGWRCSVDGLSREPRVEIQAGVVVTVPFRRPRGFDTVGVPRADLLNRRSVPRADLLNRRSVPRADLLNRRSVPRAALLNRRSIPRAALLNRRSIPRADPLNRRGTAPGHAIDGVSPQVIEPRLARDGPWLGRWDGAAQLTGSSLGEPLTYEVAHSRDALPSLFSLLTIVVETAIM